MLLQRYSGLGTHTQPGDRSAELGTKAKFCPICGGGKGGFPQEYQVHRMVTIKGFDQFHFLSPSAFKSVSKNRIITE